MQKNPDLTKALLDCWRTTNQTTIHLVKIIAPGLWTKRIPGYRNKTIGMLAIHLHNARCMWIKSIAGKNYKERPGAVHSRKGTKREVLAALNQSSDAMLSLLESCLENGGRLPARPAWLNFPNDVIHLLAYFVAHEAHHRGQMVMAARQLGQPLSRALAGELWQWTRRQKESRKSKRVN
jgi:uncharacterized damage-inducible protein DinB